MREIKGYYLEAEKGGFLLTDLETDRDVFFQFEADIEGLAVTLGFNPQDRAIEYNLCDDETCQTCERGDGHPVESQIQPLPSDYLDECCGYIRTLSDLPELEYAFRSGQRAAESNYPVDLSDYFQAD